MSNEADQEKLLARWLSGDLSDADRQLLAQENGLDDLRFALDDLEGWKVPELDVKAGLKDLKSRLDQQTAPKQTKQIFFQPWLRVAASIILIAAVAYIFNSMLTSGPTVIATGFGETMSHVLPDGSVVNLDANSSISYSAKNWEDSRELDLDGRALFTVQKGESFTVETDEGSVTVLGTIFDVKQREEGLLSVDCYEGLVRVDVETQEQLLKAGEGLMAMNGQITRKPVTGTGPQWLSLKSTFTNVALTEVVATLEDFYGLDITIPAAKANEQFAGELDYSNLDTALQTLSVVFELNFTRTGDNIVFE